MFEVAALPLALKQLPPELLAQAADAWNEPTSPTQPSDAQMRPSDAAASSEEEVQTHLGGSPRPQRPFRTPPELLSRGGVATRGELRCAVGRRS